jgi:hypothetical protein
MFTDAPVCNPLGLPRTLAEPPPAGPPQPGAGTTSCYGVADPDLPGFVARAAGECLDLLGLLRHYRAPGPSEHWQAAASAEHRLLRQAEAVAGLGAAAVGRALAAALDPDLPDADRVFAALFCAGCSRSDAVLQQAVDVFATALGRSAEEAAAATEAFSLAPRQDVAYRLAPWLDHAQARLRSAAVRVLGFRGELTAGRWRLAIADPAPFVVRAALAAHPRDLDPEAAAQALAPLWGVPDEALLNSAFCFGMGYDLPSAKQRAREIASGAPSHAHALLWLGLCGELRDSPLIAAAAQTAPEAALAAAAMAGRLPTAQRLLGALRHAHLRERALAMVVTITG